MVVTPSAVVTFTGGLMARILAGRRSRDKVNSVSEHFRVAVVGAGPAGFYAAEKLLGTDTVEVDLFDRLPTPWGLVRAGVAPDHPKIKQVTKRYEKTAEHERFRFHGNVDIGTSVTHADLTDHFHAVMYTTGASIGRSLGIPGEELDGCESATDFVAWYNGHPEGVDHHFDLSSHRAIVVGNGNVALDVARMLMLPEAKLRETDVANHALEKLIGGAISEVIVLGRRGPAQAAYTTPELRELESFTGATVLVDTQGGSLDEPEDAETRVKKNLEVARGYAENDPPADGRAIVLRFLTSPVEVLGGEQVSGLKVARNELVDGRATPTDDVEEIDCGLVIYAVGYRGRPIPDVPFDESSGTIPNVDGRVSDGVYTAGWAKRGPSGIIGTNKKCANETAAALIEDLEAGRLPTPPKDRASLEALLGDTGVVDYAGWERIDAHERAAGEAEDRPRIKLTDVAAMLDVAR
jgi:ferredoxin--NADP+ reductase